MHPSISSENVNIDGVNIHYLIAGKGAPILFIHGWPTSSYLWRDVMAELSSKHQVIAIDLPGYGKSDKGMDLSYSFRFHNQIIDGLLAHLDIDNITIGVHDLGGPIGLYWMITNMERVSRLILLNTLVYPKFSTAVKIFAMATMLPGVRSWLTSPRGIGWAMKFGVLQKDKLTSHTIREYQSYFLEKKDRGSLTKSVHRLSIKGYHEIAEKYQTFKGPVQIIYGAKDKILPKVGATMEKVKATLPQANIHVLNNCGHFIQEEEPEEIGKVILDFMNN